MTRKIRLGAFIPATGQHVAAWRHPESQPDKAVDFDFIKEQVQLAEKGLFDAYFLADGLAVNFGQAEKNGYSDKVAGFEPVTLFAALSTVTKHIGFIATASTTYEEPYLLALKFVSLDHLSHGRAGWNVVTSASESAAANFGYEQQIPHAERYERAQEYVELIKKLWDSWEDDAFLHDKASGVFYDAEKVHNPNHKGEYYSVKGALNVPRTPQGYPVIVQAGQSGPGRDLAARYAEVIFTANQKLEDAQEFYRDVKGRLAKYGRSTDELLILPGVSAFVGRTENHFELIDLAPQHKAFIRHCGGTLNETEITRNEKKIAKSGTKTNYATATLDETRALFEEGYEIQDIAVERGLTPATIINHLAKLHKEQGLDISVAHPGDEVVEQVRKIYKRLMKRQSAENFSEEGSIKLRPIVEATNPRMGYDQVRLALLFVE